MMLIKKKNNPPNPLHPRFIEIPKQELSFATNLTADSCPEESGDADDAD